MLRFSGQSSFFERSKNYGPVGYFISEVSDYELSMDKFIYEFARRENSLARRLTKRFPLPSMEKVRFVLNACFGVPILRSVPIFLDGWLSYSYFWYASEELFDVRNHVAHGAIDTIALDGGGTTFIASKLKTDGKTASIQRYRFTGGLLDKLADNASTLRRYCNSLRDTLIGESCWESRYQDDKKMIENRRLLGEMGIQSSLLSAFNASAPMADG